MSLVIKIDRAKLHTDIKTGQQEIRFSGSLKIEPDTYPGDITEETVAEALIQGIEEKLKKVKSVRKSKQE